MKIKGIEFEEKELDGKFILSARIPDLELFKEINALVKAHGGTYKRPMSFVFNEKPNFEVVEVPAEVAPVAIAPAEVEPVIEEAKEVEPEVEVVEATEVVDTKSENKIIELNSKKDEDDEIAKQREHNLKLIEEANKLIEAAHKKEAEAKAVSAEELPAGTTIEFHSTTSLELCNEHIDKLMAKEEYQAFDHQRLLTLLKERCVEDEELRANIPYKKYCEMLEKGGKAYCREAKTIKNGIGVGTADAILDYVIAEYKKAKTVETPKDAKTKKTKKK